MPSRQITDLCEEMQPLACQFISRANGDPIIKNAGAEVFLTCTYRSGDEQDAEFAKGRTAKGVPCRCQGRTNMVGTCKKHPLGLTVTRAQAGQSPHNCVGANRPAARAFDFALRLPNGLLDWEANGAIWRRAIAIGNDLGLQSGGKWGDWPHFELKNWKDIPL